MRTHSHTHTLSHTHTHSHTHAFSHTLTRTYTHSHTCTCTHTPLNESIIQQVTGGRWVPACSERFPWKRNQISFAEDRDFQQAGLLPSETASVARGSRNDQKRVPVPAGLAERWAPGHHIVYGARPCLHWPSSLQAQAPHLSPQSSWVSTDLQTSAK